jgi:hypothetical protein
LFRSVRSVFTGVMLPLPFAFARISKFGGKRSRGRTNVLTVHGSCSGGVASSIITIFASVLAAFVKKKRKALTVGPDAGGYANYFALVFLVIDDGPNSE